MMRQIIVPLDGSARAESALPIAAHIARAHEGTLSLIRIVGASADYAWYAGEMAMMLPEVMEAERKEATDYLAQVAASPALRHLDVKTKVIEGETAHEILAFAHTQQADMIVLCSHGARGLKRWMLGSVAHKIARHSSVPVLILREGERLPLALTEQATRSVRVLVPLDGSALAEEALKPAIALSQALSAPDKAAIHLLCVLPVYDLATSVESAQLIKEARTYLKQVEDELQQKQAQKTTLTVTSALIQDTEVALALVNYGEEASPNMEHSRRCDLIAMATHGRGGLKRWVMGSIAERVLEKTKLPLLVVRPEKIARGDIVLDGAHEGRSEGGEEKERWEQSHVGLL
ncbi:universal stress protein UspA [Ktedonospora formicarum]|uniref:Universal stress protein UspA n=2 Tax=Ktedonospora formicarum TaxID=2778364 RepID=A0A8J3I7W1_9CHLR|nr:universal stress protein UspA [Ktedonospora formicarum]